jgi:hypothetical protein
VLCEIDERTQLHVGVSRDQTVHPSNMRTEALIFGIIYPADEIEIDAPWWLLLLPWRLLSRDLPSQMNPRIRGENRHRSFELFEYELSSQRNTDETWPKTEQTLE